eukprot:1924744-Pleurochrysis_carterae.AAC.1
MLQREIRTARAHRAEPMLQLAMRASCTTLRGILGKIARGRTRFGALQLSCSHEAPKLQSSCRRSHRSRPANSEPKVKVRHAQRI